MGAVTKDFLLQKAASPFRYPNIGVRDCILMADNIQEARENLGRLQAEVAKALEQIASIPDDIQLIN
jgi:hypothetical protein